MILRYYDGAFMSLLFFTKETGRNKRGKRNFDFILGSSRIEEEDFSMRFGWLVEI